MLSSFFVSSIIREEFSNAITHAKAILKLQYSVIVLCYMWFMVNYALYYMQPGRYVFALREFTYTDWAW